MEELRASGLHPHYAPVIQYRYALSTDHGQSWSVTSNPVPVGKVAQATRFMHSASAAMADGNLLTCFIDYERGTKTRKEAQMQIRRGRLGGEPDVTWAAGTSFTNLAPFSMIRLPDKAFLLSAQQIPGKPRGCVILKGSADAREWERLSFLPPVGELSMSETEMSAWPDGRVIAIIRAEWFDTPKGRLPPEANGNGTNRDGYGYFLYQATSSDGGKTWSKPAQLPIWGHPACLVQLRSGNLLMVYGHRRPPFSVRAILSHDRGASWDLASMVELHRFDPGNYDIGYPVATELDNGEVLVAYYGYSTRDTGLNTPHGIFCTRLAEKTADTYETRKARLLNIEAEQELSNDLYGSTAIANLAVGKRTQEANARLRWVAEWFEHPHPKGRDPKGECDFAALKLCRAYHLFRDKGLEPATLQRLNQFFLTKDFSSMYGSENHALIFHTARQLMAQAHPQATWPAYGKSGRELAAEDRAWLERFLRFRAQRGWGEFDSAVYLGEDWECLCCLFDFSEEPRLKRLAQMMMDLMLAEMSTESLQGMYCGAHGRIYPPQALDHATEETYGLQHLYFGVGNPSQLPRLKVDALTSAYRPSPLVTKIALDRPEPYESRERKHLHNVDDLLPEHPLAGSIRKYTYCTPQYVMGCVQYQDPYPAGQHSGWYAHHQQHQWDLTMAGDTTARLFTHHPGRDGEHNYWTGDLGCGCGQFFQNKTAVIALYNIPRKQANQFIHAYVPRSAFDSVIDEDGAVFARKGDVCAMVRISGGYEWTREGEWQNREIISRGPQHAVACEVGLVSDFGSFEAFRRECLGNELRFDTNRMELEYRSKRAGVLWLDTRGGRKLNGQDAKLDYASYDCPYLESPWGSGVITLKHGTNQLRLDFTQP